MARDPPVFVYRHYIQDKGTFIWPCVVLALGIAVVAVTHRLAVY